MEVRVLEISMELVVKYHEIDIVEIYKSS